MVAEPVWGCLGGSFNPAHVGHRHVAKQAMRHAGLDQVWLLVSPGNVLKPSEGMGSFSARLSSAAEIADGRRIVATGIEQALRTRYSIDTVRELQRRFPNVRFVWIMGADILAELPRWRRWREFVEQVPLLILPRPGFTRRALASQAGSWMRGWRLPLSAAIRLADQAPPAWVLLRTPENPISATAIRAREGGVS